MPAFESLFGRPSSVQAQAPGRVNLIGEHTDYNGGFVLPVAIPQRTTVELAVRSDRLVRAWSGNFAQGGSMEFALGREEAGRGWIDYIQGVTYVLRSAGYALAGFDVRIESTVPVGSGLSSSAALEVSLLKALRTAFDLNIDDVEVARLARRGENEFVGAPVGIMDPMAASLAETNAALLIDARALTWERVPLPASVELVVINSGISHHHASGEYRVRRDECTRAAATLGVQELRDVGAAAMDRVAGLPPPLDRRVRHVVTENQRVLDAVQAFHSGDAERAGRLFDESHASMRDDYEVSIAEIDRLVEIARSEPEVFGARLTGGGFGGSIVALVGTGFAKQAGQAIVQKARPEIGGQVALLVPM